MAISFPFEFLISGTPVSFQSRNSTAKAQWKVRVQDASSKALPQPNQASDDSLAVTIYYLPDGEMKGDVDNIVKLILDGMCEHVFIDDRQVERVVVQKFEPEKVFSFANPSNALGQALNGTRPIVYIRVSDDPFEELQ